MINNIIDTSKLVIGKKQSLKALESNNVEKIYIAKDADSFVTKDIVSICEQSGVEIIYIDSKKELGKLCRIEVAAAVVALIK